MTINDVVMCGLTTAMNQIFSEQGETIDKIKVALPANLRFKFYKSRQHVKMENKFACLPLEVPLPKTMEGAYKQISKETKKLKNSAGILYTMYAMSYWCNKLLPRFVSQQICADLGGTFTIALSNTPGAIKYYKYRNKKTGSIMQLMSSTSYIMVAGNLGMGMCVYSLCGKLHFSFTTDDAICNHSMNKHVMSLTTSYILEEIQKMKDEK